MVGRLKVALNGRFSGTSKPTGTQVVAYQLYSRILRTQRNFDVVFFCDKRFKDLEKWADLPGVELVHLPFLDWSRLKSQVWEQLSFPAAAHRKGCRLLHSPITTSPFHSRGLKSVVTFHDFNFKLHPEWFSRSFTTFLEFSGIMAARRADRVVVISDYVRDHAERYLGLPSSRILRVYNGLNPLVESPSPIGSKSDSPNILCVGSLQPHKNLLRTIHGYQIARKSHPGLTLKVVGRPQGNFSAIPGLQEALGTPGVELLGYLSDDELASAYSRATVFCYPSLEEGFGLPILEAMSAGAPVVTSNLSCLPEIAGGAAILCDPTSVESIASSLETVLSLNPENRRELIQKGIARCQDFSWEASAARYIEIFEEVLK